MWDPFKTSNVRVSIVDALTIQLWYQSQWLQNRSAPCVQTLRENVG